MNRWESLSGNVSRSQGGGKLLYSEGAFGVKSTKYAALHGTLVRPVGNLL
jgi:hypothetical protein